jgi:hypothetical protein
MILQLRKYQKRIVAFMLLVFFSEILAPTAAFALTSGPSQPEVQSFEPVNTTTMVEPSSGDFNYNIPLMDVQGYPINISYHSGVTMDQEASWVGLGWNINPGVINRSMRGTPDDFSGDEIIKEFNIRKNWNAGVNLGAGVELATVGLGINASSGIFYNNYKGVGLEAGISFGYSIPKSGDSKTSVGVNLGLNLNSQEGSTVTGGVSLSVKQDDVNNQSSSIGANIGLSYNSRVGLSQLSYGVSASHSGLRKNPKKDKDGNTNQYDRSSSGIFNASSSISFLSTEINPSISLPMQNLSFSAKIKLGGLISTVNLSGDLSGNYSEQKLRYHREKLKSYGYLYMQNAKNDPRALLDFSREKDMPFRLPEPRKGDEGSPITGIPSFDYDLMAVNGQGVSGQFRAKRGEVGSVYSHYVNNDSYTGSFNGDVGFGNLADFGIDISLSMSETTVGQWQSGNAMFGRAQFQDFNNTLFEPVYFINNGEKTITDPSFENGIGDDSRAYHLELKRDFPFNHQMIPKLVDKFFQKQSFNVFRKANRDKRNQVMSYLTAGEAEVAALDKEIKSYEKNIVSIDRCGVGVSQPNRIAHANGKKHHISEVSILGTDGKRYIYGIPAYNRRQTDYTFNVGNIGTIPEDGILADGRYTAQDASVQNQKGKDHYFQSQTIPGFAHSYLLTSVLSSDYHDLTGNGVSSDDLGDGVKINYFKAHNDFKWRTPFAGANYQEGYKGIKDDDKANFVYGEKEIWYVHSIESKTMVALFHMSDRQDGLGVVSEIKGGSGSGSAQLQKLDSISLYSKSDLMKFGQSGAVPLKRVHFRYDYSLCPGTLNSSQGGKLTLKEIHYTYQRNSKGRLNPYKFTYNSFNPSYNIKKYDRWGYYKDNYDIPSQLPGFGVSESEFPYTPQDKATTDHNLQAWSLKEVQLPSGGIITVELESDDYSYVQDKRSTQMFQVLGMGSNGNPNSNSVTNNSFYNSNHISPSHNRFIYVKVNSAINPSNAKNEINAKYLDGINDFYYRFAIKMYSSDAPNDAEYVPGYFKIKDYGLCTNVGSNDIIWLEVTHSNVCNTCSQEANSILVDALQFLRLNQPSKAYPGSEPGSEDFMAVIKALSGMIMDIQNLVMGFNKTGMSRGYCRYIVPERSWVRLNCPQKTKLGGGNRVKQITISDNWQSMKNSELTASYGQKYDYTMEEGGQIISSGVASYEPQIGQDENPLRRPLVYKQTSRLVPNTNMFIEFPLCENLFPSPDVVYRKVKIESINNAQVDISKGIGYTINEYFTAFDFPLEWDYTPLVSKKNLLISKTPSFWSLFKFPSKKEFWVSQGYSIELNDMHGKPKSVTTYDNQSSLLSSNVFHYKVKSSNPKKLDNLVDVMMQDGTVEQREVGKDVETMFDNRQHETRNRSMSIAINIDLNYFPPVVFFPIVTGLPFFGQDLITYKSLNMTKVIHRFGVLDRVEARQEGSYVVTKNLLHDSETGEVLLTKTSNEFNDPIFNFTYPAHLAYEGMGGAYKNIGAIFRNIDFKSGRIIAPSSIEQYFTAGDEIYGESKFPQRKELIWASNPAVTGGANHMLFIDKDGKPLNGKFDYIKITRSGRRNMGTTPIGTISSLVNPIQGNTLSIDTSIHILNTSFSEFSQFWQTSCEKVPSTECDSCPPPNCDCMQNILEQIIAGNHLNAQPEDSVFVNMCCLPPCKLDSCSCQAVSECSKRHYYALSSDFPSNADFYGMLGHCKIKIHKEGTSKPTFIPSNVPLTSIRMIDRSDFISPDGCDSVCDFYNRTGTYPLIGTQKMPNGTFKYAKFFASIECEDACKQTCKDLLVDNTINPYRYGILGDWRPFKTWVYKGLRTPTDFRIDGVTDIRRDGYYVSFNKFWDHYDNATGLWVKTTNLTNYIDATTVTKYNTKGAEVENRDAAGIYTSATFGYLNTLATAIAKNARYKQIAFDGFEDYDYKTECDNPCRVPHFWFQKSLIDYPNSCEIDTTVAHSGLRSIKVTGPISAVRYEIKPDSLGWGVSFNTTDTTFHLKKEGCLPKFSPDSGKYVVSAWVKEEGTCSQLQDTLSKVFICYDGSMDSASFKASGNKIEGWQRIEGSFTIPSNATSIKVQLIAPIGKTAYFDDIRIHPFNSNLKSYAYDNRSLRLMAELDENNYATFYEYDDEGGLIRVKKETARGIMTIKETRSALNKLLP